MRIALVTTADPDAVPFDIDLAPMTIALEAAGCDVTSAAWEDDTIEWHAFDLVVIRSPWNYTERRDEFRTWLADRRDVVRFHNPIDVIEWNIDKRYLAELEARGVPTVPTKFCADLLEFDRAVASLAVDEIVVKPTISAGSRLTGRFDRTSPVARELAARILGDGLEVMVQPHCASVDVEGEIGTVFIDGERSHSFRKGRILDRDGAYVGGEYREDITAIVVPDDVRELADSAFAVVSELLAGQGRLPSAEPLLYARIDVIRLDDGTPAFLEAELFEPSLFVDTAPGSADRFAAACRRRIDQLRS